MVIQNANKQSNISYQNLLIRIGEHEQDKNIYTLFTLADR